MGAQFAVHLRQKLINDLDVDGNADRDLKIDVPAPKPDHYIRHYDLWWMPSIGTIVIMLQLAVIGRVH
jgi:hypothetical protein